MNPYSTFHFSGYSWNHHAGKISLKYSLDQSLGFEEIILLPEPISDERLKAKEWEIERALFALHMIGGISYYKTCLPKEIRVHSGELNRSEVAFWTNVYENGLGEFFYRNNIDFRGLIKFPVSQKSIVKSQQLLRPKGKTNRLIHEQRVLVPIGGGKDSLVTIELLKKAGAKVTLLRMGHHPVIEELAHQAGLPMLTLKRSISGNLFDLNAQGALNGHVPITAYLSILAVLCAILYDFDAVILSNERSANIGNVEFKGLMINHQWSKSMEFEKALRKYIAETIKSDVEYFSLLRPLSELKITEMFSKYPQYFDTATSCNKNWKILSSPHPLPLSRGERGEKTSEMGAWCKDCPKCAFVYALYAAFIPRKKLMKIFGGDCFSEPALQTTYRELLGVEGTKPFECVGTPRETAAAFLLAKKRGDLDSTPAMQMFVKEVLPTIKDQQGLIDESLAMSEAHCVPEVWRATIDC